MFTYWPFLDTSGISSLLLNWPTLFFTVLVFGISVAAVQLADYLCQFDFSQFWCFVDFFALTPTQRRRQRKNRALARRLWYEIKGGQRKSDTQTLNWIWTTLSQHHSRDPLFLWRVRVACKTTAAMDRQGWKCGVCRIMNRKKAEFCQSCGGHWHTCFEEDNSWSWSAGNATQSSPRPRSGSARRRSQRQSTKGTSKGNCLLYFNIYKYYDCLTNSTKLLINYIIYKLQVMKLLYKQQIVIIITKLINIYFLFNQINKLINLNQV